MVTTAMDFGGDRVGGIAPPGDEDYIQLQPPQIPPGWVAPQPQPHKVKLPPFWTQKQGIWFSHMEAVFSTFNVTEERTRFNLVLPCLSEEILTRVAAVVAAPAGGVSARSMGIHAFAASSLGAWRSEA